MSTEERAPSSSNPLASFERLYAEQPGKYRAKVRAWMALGYGYVLGVVGLLLLLVVGGGYLVLSGRMPLGLIDNYLKLGLPAVALCGVMLRGFLIRVPEPEGVKLDGDLKKQVIAFFEPLRESCDGPKVNAVYIQNELNAAVQQSRPFGIVGPTRNYLILGLPLLELASDDEIKAVVAHEFGHLSKAHGKMGASVYRAYSTLFSAAEAIREKSSSGVDGVAFRFFRWFIPKFDELTFAMRRAQEYEADRVAAEATSESAIATVLCRLAALQSGYGAHWNSVWQRAVDEPSVESINPFTGMHAGVYAGLSKAECNRAIDDRLEQDTNYEDTHPCLRERLAALPAEPAYDLDSVRPALSQMFSDQEIAEVRELVTRQWREAAADSWQAAHAQHQENLAELESLRGTDQIDSAAALYTARLEEYYGERSAAMAAFRIAASAADATAEARIEFARREIENDFEPGAKLLMAIVREHDSYLPEFAGVLHAGFTERDMEAEREELEALISSYNATQDAAQKERSGIAADDPLVTADIDAELRDRLTAMLEARPGVDSLYLAEKPVSVFPENRVYLVGTEVRYFSDDVDANLDKWLDGLIDELYGVFPERVTILGIVLKKDTEYWKERFQQIDGSRVYTRVKPSFGTRALHLFWRAAKATLKWLALVLVIVIVAATAQHFGLIDLSR